MKAILRKIWGHILVWGILSVLFGIISFAWPGLTLTTLVYLFAIAVIAEGIAVLAGAWQAKNENQNWWIMLLTGIINIIAGIICIANPGITALFFVVLIGISWLITGLMEIYAAITLRKEIANEGWLALAGILSVLAGLFLIFRTGEGALALVWLIAGFAVIFGVILILLALKAKSWIGGIATR
jgi:uncharacterized membrane protein HdeD (DUF308 family)